MTQVPANLQDALRDWRALLGAERVLDDSSTLARYGKSTLPRAHRPGCVLYPTSTEEVAGIVAIANAHGVALHPVSGGCNWGYGDATPSAAGAAIVDLGRMNRIIAVDAELGVAIIEPGVTQGQLYARVQADAPDFWLDCSGAGPAASIVGNTLQRGFGHTASADRVRSLAGLEVVLGNGAVIRTGLTHYPDARAAWLYPYGFGPHVDPLFTQSNFGIVTRMGLHLCPRPEDFRFFWVRVEGDDALEALIEALRPLRMRGILRSAVHIGNDMRLISAAYSYPWEEAGGATPLPAEIRQRLRKKLGCGAWNVAGALAGTPEEVLGGMSRLRAATRRVGRCMFIGTGKMRALEALAGCLRVLHIAPDLMRKIEALGDNFHLNRGVPRRGPLRGVSWRLRGAPDVELPGERCGLIWVAPVLPLRGKDARRVCEIASEALGRHGFDMMVTFTMLNERAMVAVFNISFDRSVTADCDAALACKAELTEALLAAGYVPYRGASSGSEALTAAGDSFWDFARSIKAALDPRSIVSPGLYGSEQPGDDRGEA